MNASDWYCVGQYATTTVNALTPEEAAHTARRRLTLKVYGTAKVKDTSPIKVRRISGMAMTGYVYVYGEAS
jgi:hypothetical protein